MDPANPTEYLEVRGKLSRSFPTSPVRSTSGSESAMGIQISRRLTTTPIASSSS